MKRYKQAQPATRTVITRPSRPASVEADVLVPLLQTAVTAFLTGLLSWLTLATLKAPRPLLWSIAIALLAALALFAYLLHANRPLLQETELITNRDLNQDNHIGPPPPHPIETINRSPDNKHILLGRIPFRSRKDAILLATGIISRNLNFSRRALTDAAAFPDDPDYYSQIYNAMLQMQYLTPSGSGAELTPAGKDFLLQILQSHAVGGRSGR